MMLWTGSEFTTCTGLHNDPDEPEEGYDPLEGRRSAQMLGGVMIYCFCMIVGVVGGFVWWLHR